MSRVRVLLISFAVSFLVSGCSDDSRSANETAKVSASGGPKAIAGSRWYGSDRVQRGATIFAENCAGCHGKKANGYFTWRTRGPDGKFPPPPLNGTGHAWHHPLPVLVSQIKYGAQNDQGKMPGFGQTLSDQEIFDVIAWFQEFWPDDLYARAN
jgi:mono/diheme cytochrome c family protein